MFQIFIFLHQSATTSQPNDQKSVHTSDWRLGSIRYTDHFHLWVQRGVLFLQVRTAGLQLSAFLSHDSLLLLPRGLWKTTTTTRHSFTLYHSGNIFSQICLFVRFVFKKNTSVVYSLVYFFLHNTTILHVQNTKTSVSFSLLQCSGILGGVMLHDKPPLFQNAFQALPSILRCKWSPPLPWTFCLYTPFILQCKWHPPTLPPFFLDTILCWFGGGCLLLMHLVTFSR